MGLFDRWRSRGRPPGSDDRSPRLGLKAKDLAVLAQLVHAGADLSQPRHVLHYLHFSTEEAARHAEPEARAAGWDVEVRPPLPAYPDLWSLICQRRDVVVNPDTVRQSHDVLQALADRHGGEYDGWEAAV